MTYREVKKAVKGRATVDGAGVHLVRVLSNETVEDYDPFLMLDSFDSKEPSLYIKGFPYHPHRGIETITYLIQGQMIHEDSLGNKGVINSGESQWMTAGSGIMHQEMPQASERMLGLQIWLNLPKKDKMASPKYFDIKKDMIPLVEDGPAEVRIISGNYKGTHGVKPSYVQATLYDVLIKPNSRFEIETNPDDNVFIFLVEGPIKTGGHEFPPKNAVLYESSGRAIDLATKDEPCRLIYFSGPRLKEKVAWGGPIVMNTKEELALAFEELEKGTFIKK
ncbi:MAG: pirin family protein [Deltaproteobacteria bacterium]|jgi:redox-sensitive bicupin YhaK (pirin superfamily)|nr:pirin family protein [Deltaproteobacteria bacterium]